MSEEKKEASPKKGSKLPLIMVMVVMLGAGGFFGMKMKGGAAKKPEVKLSKDKPMDLKEFLVNLKDKGVYCRTEVSLGLAEGVDEKALEDKTPIIRDAINMCLINETLAETSSLDQLRALKKEIAKQVNAALNAEDEAKTSAGDAAAQKDSTGQADDKSKKAPGDSVAATDANPKHPDWDSQTGPVLKVYFDSFATQ